MLAKGTSAGFGAERLMRVSFRLCFVVRVFFVCHNQNDSKIRVSAPA
jgi:hypothetical protein